MKTIGTTISKLNNGDTFYVSSREYLFVGKTKSKGIESYVGCDQGTGKFVGFHPCQSVEIPRPKPVRTDFWYKKKFVELVYCTMEHDKVEARFSKICSHLHAVICRGCSSRDASIEELGGEYCRSNYIITANYKILDGVTVMLINTVTGKSVACKHIDPDKVNSNNIHLILFDLYKKYMNQ